MSYQPGWNPPQGSWSPGGPNVQQPLNGGQNQPPQHSGFQVPPQLSETARQTLSEIGAQMDRDYIKTIPGCLSVMTTVTSFLAFVISSTNSASLFTLVSGFGFWCALIFFVVNLFQVPSKVPALPWLQLEFIFLAVWTVLYFLCTLVMIFPNPALGMMAIVCLITFGYATFQKLREHHQYLAMQSTVVSSPVNSI